MPNDPAVRTTLLMSGFDLHLMELPPDARLLAAPDPLPPLDDYERSMAESIDIQLSTRAFAKVAGPNARVAIAVDDFGLPVPMAQRDCRAEMLRTVLGVLEKRGVHRSRICVLVANGLSRQWRPAELVDLLGEPGVAVANHDAEAFSNLSRIGELGGAPLELNRSLVEADLVVYLNVVSTPLHAGLYGLVSGTCGYRTARALNAPKLFDDEAPLSPGSAYLKLHEEAGAALQAKVPVLQVSTVLDNALMGSKLASLLTREPGLSRPLQVWNAIPAAVRLRAARFLRSSYRPFEVLAGTPEEVAPMALEAFRTQHETPGEGGADILVFGVPDVGPASVGTQQDPVLATGLALGWIAQLFNGKPLVRKGGAIVFANPLTPQFDAAHAPHQELYEKVLRMEREPAAIHERFEPYFAGRPEFVSGYQRRFHFHGVHPLTTWYQCTPARKRAGRIIVAYGDPRACARLGFSPATDVQDGIEKAAEFLGGTPKVAVLQLPPPFWVRTA